MPLAAVIRASAVIRLAFEVPTLFGHFGSFKRAPISAKNRAANGQSGLNYSVPRDL